MFYIHFFISIPKIKAMHKQIKKLQAFKIGRVGQSLAPLKRMQFQVKGLLKSSDKKTKQQLSELNVQYSTPTKRLPVEALHSHIRSIRRKRDKGTLGHKRTLAKVFKDSHDAVGLSKQFVTESVTKDSSLYASKGSKVQKMISDFFDSAAVDDPCKSSRSRKQLTKPVKELYKEFKVKHENVKVSVRTLHRHKPKKVTSVTRLKFRQCLCEVQGYERD